MCEHDSVDQNVTIAELKLRNHGERVNILIDISSYALVWNIQSTHRAF